MKSEKGRSVVLIGLTIIFLFLISFIPGNINLGIYSTKPVDILSDIKPDSILTSSNFDNDHISLLAATTPELLEEFYNTLFNTPSAPAIENVGQMKFFFDALQQTKNKKVRVAHYGDSGIEGDLITADIRQTLQSKFGGNGTGLLAITSQDITFRMSTKHSFSDNWKSYSVVNNKSSDYNYGINGFVAVPQSGSWAKYEATSFYKSSLSFKSAKIYYYGAKASSIKYSINNGAEQNANLVAGNDVKELTLNGSGDIKSFKFTATQPAQANFFGVSLESGNGVYVDNFPWRGNTGVSLRDIKPETYKAFNRYMGYKLIILSFGGNMIDSDFKDFTWYENQMTKVITDLKADFPQTSILIVGVGDKALKKGSSFVTDPNVPRLVEVQKNIAAKTGVSFWNLYEAMGGENSMAKWVNANPPLAMKDYTHVNLQGGQKIANMLVNAIMDEFNKSK